LCSKKKEKEKKRNINNDLAVLPSYDMKWFFTVKLRGNANTGLVLGREYKVRPIMTW